MNSDCSFNIGSTHKVCEDYAIANDSYYDMSLIVLADGCSSSTDSDIGARILVKATEARELTKISGLSFEGNIYINNAKNVSNLMNLDETALDATLLMAKVQDGRCMICCYGDGVTVIGYKDGSTRIRSVSFLTAYPQYLSYELNTQRRKFFDEVDKGAKLETVELSEKETTFNSVDTHIPSIYRDCIDDISFIAIMSDGIHSFYEQVQTETSMTKKAVDYVTVIKELLDIKGRKGCFVHRLFNRFKKSCEAKNWYHSDDLSLAVINVE